MKKSKRRGSVKQAANNQQRGGAIIMAVLLVLMTGILTGGIIMMTTSSAIQTSITGYYEEAYLVAEAGLKTSMFEMEAEMGTPDAIQEVEPYLAKNLGRDYTGDFGNGNFTVTLSDPISGDSRFTLVSVGEVNGAQRTLTAIIGAEDDQPSALDYALFGNYIHFDNHGKLDWGLRLNTSIYSNSSILIDSGVRIEGIVRAVQFISPNTGPAGGKGGVPDTILFPAGEQGDPDPDPVVATAPVKQVVPGPAVMPFPSFDFEGVEKDAIAAGRYLDSSTFDDLISNAVSYARSLPGNNTEVPLPASDYPTEVDNTVIKVRVIHHDHPVEADRRFIRVPHADDPDNTIGVGSPDGVSAGTQEVYEVIIDGDPLPGVDSYIYVEGGLDIRLPNDVLFRMEGSLIVNGTFGLHAAAEILAWENRQAPWFVGPGSTLYDFAQNTSEVSDMTKDVRYSRHPAIAANGKIKIDKSGTSQGGAAHIEGVVYTVDESHLHRSDLRELAYSVGGQIADVVHNCQFFSFAYDPAAKGTIGFYQRISGRPILKIISITN